MSAPYRRLVYEVPAALEELWEARLSLASSLGWRTLESAPADPWGEPGELPPRDSDTLRLEVYFAQGETPPQPLAGIRLLADDGFEAEDWMGAWRASVQPLPVGGRFLVDPREVDEAPPEVPRGRFWLRLPARQAFGTGSHETTRLMLEMLEDLEHQEVRDTEVLDVGTGSGILAFAALCLGAARVVGFDIDVAAAVAAAQNRGYNPHLAPAFAGRRLAFFAGTLEALAPGHSSSQPSGQPPSSQARGQAFYGESGQAAGGLFNLALVNVLPERLRPHLDALCPCLAPGARALVSGVLAQRQEEVEAALSERGLERRKVYREGEWVGLLCRLRAEARVEGLQGRGEGSSPR
ncbi:MAG: 50S ribosomal protein L11 methyltransferase [Acidobacteriota bacterium]